MENIEINGESYQKIDRANKWEKILFVDFLGSTFQN